MPTLIELERAYEAKHTKSKELYKRAMNYFSSGVTHDARFEKPFPIYAVKAKEATKWDVDGNDYVDYIMGHGGLLLGYGDERVIKAFQEQIPKAMHMGTSTELEIEWADLIQKLVPCARNSFVRATSCGGEAVAMAIRLARIYSDREKIVLHAGSYHGKADTTIFVSRGPPFGLSNVRGIPSGVKEDILIVPYNSLDSVENAFDNYEVACIILQGNALYTREYIEGLRKLTKEYGVVFIIDEVVSGFRYAAGGAQEYYGVTPDLAVLGKICGGGAPVGAICGKKEIMDLYSFRDDYWNRFMRINVGGTWNAQPLCIVGGTTVMKIIETENKSLYSKLYAIGRRLTESFNDQAEDLGVSAQAVGLPIENPTTFSVNLFNRPVPPEMEYLWESGPTTFEDYDTKAGFNAGSQAGYVFYLSMMNSGINAFHGRSFITCTKYSEEDLKRTETAFGTALKVLKENKLVGINK